MTTAPQLYVKDCIRTISGKYVNVFEPTEDMICIEDIAHALSLICRFTGHTPYLYSVAQHSLNVCNFSPPTHKLPGLLHDATEAYLSDLASPIKARMHEYKVIESNLWQVIARKFGVDPVIPSMVHAADWYMLEYEWQHLIVTPSPTDNLVGSIPQALAKQNFIDMFHRLDALRTIPQKT